MEDRELIRIAAFKLRDSANRLMTLANQAQSAKVRGRLQAVCEQLRKHEKRVFATRQSGKLA
jgi:hypothetical protein